MVDIMDVYKSLNMSIRKVIKKSEMINFVHDQLKS